MNCLNQQCRSCCSAHTNWKLGWISSEIRQVLICWMSSSHQPTGSCWNWVEWTQLVWTSDQYKRCPVLPNLLWPPIKWKIQRTQCPLLFTYLTNTDIYVPPLRRPSRISHETETSTLRKSSRSYLRGSTWKETVKIIVNTTNTEGDHCTSTKTLKIDWWIC